MTILFMMPFAIHTDSAEAKYYKVTAVSDLSFYDTLYGKYPLVGADEPSAYYLDTTSCYSHIDGNVATVSCIVLATGGGALAGGNPAMITPETYIFKTYKKKNKRVIILGSRSNKDREIYGNINADKDKYLYALFWRAAGITGINHVLD